MGTADIADQLQNYYRFDHWMRKWKWLWSLFFWAFGVLFVNAYVCYWHYTISIGRCPMSHYDFHKSIALAWLDPKVYWPNQMVKRAAESKKRNVNDSINVNVARQGEGQDSSSNDRGGSSQTTGAAPTRSKTKHLLSWMIPCVHEQEHYNSGLRCVVEIIFQHYNQQREQSVHFTIGQARREHDHTSSGVKHVVFISVLSAFHCFTHLKSQVISRLVCKPVKCTKNSNM